MKRSSLWTKNFTIITLGTLISAIGGIAMGLGLSLVVFDETQSTFMSGLFATMSVLPDVTLPILFGPVIDRVNRKHVIVGLDLFNGVWYLLFLAFVRRYGFVYSAYMLFMFVSGCVGAVYGLAYGSLYPDIIPDGCAQQGYAVSGLIYPLAATVVTPLAALLYGKWGVELLIGAEGVLLLVAAAFESRIDDVHTAQEGAPTLAQYRADMLEGFRYLEREKGVRSIYSYMMLANAASDGCGMMAMAHFRTAGGFTTAMYGLLDTAETLGRLAGSALHYLFKISEEKRYTLTVQVYMLYEVCEGVMLFVAYPLMLVLRFACGFLGAQTAAIRSAAVQKYLPQDMRARVNGLFSVLCALGQMGVQLGMGLLGEVMSYAWAAALMAAVTFAAILLLIVRRRADVEPVYNQRV